MEMTSTDADPPDSAVGRFNLYWVSWYQPTGDCRPLTYPPNEAVLGWWATGKRCSDDATTICAWVRAETEDAARTAILRDWPEADEWRFCEQRDRIEQSERFPPTDWMIDRILKGEEV